MSVFDTWGVLFCVIGSIALFLALGLPPTKNETRRFLGTLAVILWVGGFIMAALGRIAEKLPVVK